MGSACLELTRGATIRALEAIQSGEASYFLPQSGEYALEVYRQTGQTFPADDYSLFSPDTVLIYHPLAFSALVASNEGARVYLSQWLQRMSVYLVALSGVPERSSAGGSIGFAFYYEKPDETPFDGPEYLKRSKVYYGMNGAIVSHSDGTWEAHS